ncbi:MAG: polyprenyl synthetase family protein [Firmicutes bacterium]|nr:polyprenyl synthetase family protein [Bacillota bacterium]
MNFEQLMETRKTLIESTLDCFLPDEELHPAGLYRAMRYSVFAGGKRLRPLLVLFSAELFTTDWQRALPAACALELIHTYSLIHDDLPAMDDDDYRRGCPTSHKVFGEAVAILTGDALLTLAFEILAGNPERKNKFCSSYRKNVPAEVKLAAICELARAAGVEGMVGGQAMDLASEGKAVNAETLEYIDTHKTGELLLASVRLGALVAGAGPGELDKLTAYGKLLGRAFQIVDDILDLDGDEQKMGKAKGKDVERKKANLVSLHGLEAAKKKRDQLYAQAIGELYHFGGGAQPLREITRLAFYRDH